MRHWILLIIVLISFVEAKAGGPWTKKKGEAYGQFAMYAILPSNRLSLNNYRVKHQHRAIFDFTSELYVEYGLLDKLTLSASLPLKIVSSGTEVFPVDSSLMSDPSIVFPNKLLDAGLLVDLGNISFGAKYNFLKKKVLLTGHFVVYAPTAIQKYNPNTGLRTAYPCWGFQPSVSLGYSKDRLYTYFETGMNFRTHGYSHQWTANFEIGWKLGKKEKGVYLIVGLIACVGLPGAADIPGSTEEVQAGLYVNNQNFVALSLKSVIPISDHVGLNLSVSGGIWANNIQRGGNFGLGVYYKFKKKETPKK